MKLISQKDAEAIVQSGSKQFLYDRSVQITPGARDVFSEAGVRLVFNGGSTPSAPTAAPAGGSSSHEQLFRSKEAEQLKREICDIGRRLWQREYVDGNGGNISARVGPNEFICTPTGVSKGFLTPDMLCMVDIEGNQLAGTWKRTSEITTHLAIYRTTPAAKSVVHAHPVHATAFAITGFEPPECLIPEIEVFVGRVPLAPYRTPGSPEMAEVIGPMAPKHQSILMGNHGVICWGTSVEDAYFKMEITDAYCRTLVVASHIPNNGTYIPGNKMAELLEIKKKMGLPDTRLDAKPCSLCEVDPWEKMKDKPCACSTEATAGSSTPVTNAEIENMVQKLTDQIMHSLQKG
jgi:L-fuculose-phosphate aldolase